MLEVSIYIYHSRKLHRYRTPLWMAPEMTCFIIKIKRNLYISLSPKTDAPDQSAVTLFALGSGPEPISPPTHLHLRNWKISKCLVDILAGWQLLCVLFWQVPRPQSNEDDRTSLPDWGSDEGDHWISWLGNYMPWIWLEIHVLENRN